MDALLTSLHSLSLLPPSPSQLLQLLSNSASPEAEEQEARDLARVLSLGSYDKDAAAEASEDADDVLGSTGFGMDRELIEDAIVEMIKIFKSEISKLRAAYQAEEALQSSPQSLPKATPLHFLTLRHESSLRQSQKLNTIYGGYCPKVIFSGGPSYASEAELSSLAPITKVEDLQVGRRMQGKYLVVRVASSLSIYVGATFLVTLPAPFGFSMPASILHFTTNPRMSSEEASALLPQGTLLIIKEPYISSNHSLRAAGNLSGPGLRIDTPTDVVLLQGAGEGSGHALHSWKAPYMESLQWIKEPEPAKAGGKGAKKAALKTASSSTATTKPLSPETSAETSTLQPAWLQDGPLSRARWEKDHTSSDSASKDTLSLAHRLLKDGRPGAAWRELSAGLTGKPHPSGTNASRSPHQEAELEGDILLAMGAWVEAERVLEQATSGMGSSVPSTLLDKLSQARQRRAEAEAGPSSAGSTVATIYRSHLSSAKPRIPAADWLSPALKVAQIPNAGRGLVTTCSVSAGEPLLMAKSRGSSYPSDEQLDEYCPIIRCDFQNGVISTTTQILATTKLIHQMIDRPELTQEILGLTAGPGTRDSRWVETGRFKKAAARVGAKEVYEGLRPDRLGPEGGINSLYVDEVLRHNAFGPGVVQRGSASGETAEDGQSQAGPVQSNGSQPMSTLPRALRRKLAQDPPSAFSRSTQPHPLPAILNHSCLPNVSSVFLGDVVVTKALRDLKEGEEIGHEYVRGGVDYQSRQATLSKHGFVCACPLCDLDRQDGDNRLATRRKLFAVQAPALFSRSNALIAHRSDTAKEDDCEKHQDIKEALLSFAEELTETYDEKRGVLRPEMRETYERIGRHAERERKTVEAVKHYLLSLQAVNAHLAQRWVEFLSPSQEDHSLDTLAATLGSSHLDSSATSPLALTQSPALHVDEAQRTLWRLAQLFAGEGQRSLSLHFSRTAYHVHDILIGGGHEVFEDRWGPSGLGGASGGLEWQGAWDIWWQEAGNV
ncbi:hypothetical protein BCV69DRAFT_279748 [Microstroma glucosiphilum]|uniref:SET domain-containing protein n=1 Tax=Pseudomicrostroma glucosiphilum TaxID=1684307 RepID=A0A316UEV3_9BASI|nr:hypothetical protein BCV69DRAFT_279748 [Pseudomicrostroma glucosiphilum]PWN23837.1 hypothetical protein BCV69DRAFT_279748 [Pseudomicrostroma glucosiphilum]